MPVAQYLFALILVILLPAMAVSLVLLNGTNDAQQKVVEALTNATVQAMGQSVDREIAGMTTTLRLLSSAPNLAEEKLEQFHDQTRTALASTGAYLLGVDSEGQQLFNTRVPFGTPLGKTSDLETMRRALERTMPTISGLFYGKVAQTQVFNVWQPTPGKGEVALLALAQDAHNLVPILQSRQLPEGWNAALVDSDNMVIAATPDSGLEIGAVALLRLNSSASGQEWTRENYGDEAVVTAEWRSGLTGWRIIAWASEATVQRPLGESLLQLAAWGFVIALAASGVAVIIAQRIGLSVRGLRRDALRLGRGELVQPHSYPITEIAEVSEALADASVLRRGAERDNRFLMRELAHRSKNQMAVIAAMAKQTARGAPDVAAYVEALERRIMGLARSTDLLLAHGRAGISLHSLVELQLSPFSPGNEPRLFTDGPDIRINPQGGQLLGMALHELATNALRHGALADPNGQIELSWRIEGEMLHLHWREHLRAPLPPSNRNGFGTTVLRSMMARVLGAEVERIDHPSGLEWSFIIPLSRLDPDFSAPRPDQGDEIE